MARNYLLITADQQRWDTLGCCGNPVIRTPTLDDLAARGALGRRVYTECPICLPARNTMQTGRFARRHGVLVHCDSMRAGEPTLAGELNADGFYTACVGKMHLYSQEHRGTPESIPDALDGLDAGFDGPFAGFEHAELLLGHSNPLCGHFGRWLREHCPEAVAAYHEERLRPVPVGWSQGILDNDIPEHGHSSYWVALRTAEHIRRAASSGRPFYIHASFPDPHWPIMPPARWFHMYDGVELPANNHPPGGLFAALDAGADDATLPPPYRHLRQRPTPGYDGGSRRVVDPADVATLTRAYYGSISFVDHTLRMVVEALRETGVFDDTLTVFTSDHGEYMGDHGLMAKGGWLFESFVRVPFVACCPGEIPPGTRDGLLSLVDLAPTACGMLGRESALSFDGADLSGLLRGEADAPAREALSIHHPTNNLMGPDIHALVTERWKLIYYPGEAIGELYDLRSDPGEQTNLWADPACAAVRTELQLRLLEELTIRPDLSSLARRDAARVAGMYRHVLTREVYGAYMDPPAPPGPLDDDA